MLGSPRQVPVRLGAGAEEELGRAFHVGALVARLLGVKPVSREKRAGTESGCWDMGLHWGAGGSSYATGFGFYSVGRREPSKVIGQGSGGTGEALYGDDTGSVGLGLETGDWQEETAVSLEARTVEGNGEGTGLSQIEGAVLRVEGRGWGKRRVREAGGLELGW